MSRPVLDETRDVEFVEVKGGRVHVVKHDGIPVADGQEPDVIGYLMGATYARCGLRIVKNNGGLEASAWPTDQFADVHLCQRCAATVPADEQWRLFEHRQPDDPEES